MYLRFETEDGLEFEFFLAEKLGRTVAELRRNLTNLEYMQWAMYYARKAQRKELEIMKAKRG